MTVQVIVCLLYLNKQTLSVQAAGQAATTAKPFQPDETLVFVRLVRWALRALDIYTLPVTPPGQPAPLPGLHGGNAPTVPQRPTPPQQTVRTKEEKEVLEHFSGVVSLHQLLVPILRVYH